MVNFYASNCAKSIRRVTTEGRKINKNIEEEAVTFANKTKQKQKTQSSLFFPLSNLGQVVTLLTQVFVTDTSISSSLSRLDLVYFLTCRLILNDQQTLLKHR